MSTLNNPQSAVTLSRNTFERARVRVLTALAFLEDGQFYLLTTEDVIWLLTAAVSDLDEAQSNDAQIIHAGATADPLTEGLDWQQLAPFMEG